MLILILFFSLRFNDSISTRLNVVKVFIEYNLPKDIILNIMFLELFYLCAFQEYRRVYFGLEFIYGRK